MQPTRDLTIQEGSRRECEALIGSERRLTGPFSGSSFQFQFLHGMVCGD